MDDENANYTALEQSKAQQAAFKKRKPKEGNEIFKFIVHNGFDWIIEYRERQLAPNFFDKVHPEMNVDEEHSYREKYYLSSFKKRSSKYPTSLDIDLGNWSSYIALSYYQLYCIVVFKNCINSRFSHCVST